MEGLGFRVMGLGLEPVPAPKDGAAAAKPETQLTPPAAAPVDAVDAPPKDGAAPVDAGAELPSFAAKKLAHILTLSPSRRGDCAYIRRWPPADMLATHLPPNARAEASALSVPGDPGGPDSMSETMTCVSVTS
jgi:hypothetical protein